MGPQLDYFNAMVRHFSVLMVLVPGLGRLVCPCPGYWFHIGTAVMLACAAVTPVPLPK